MKRLNARKCCSDLLANWRCLCTACKMVFNAAIVPAIADSFTEKDEVEVVSSVPLLVFAP